MNEENGEQHETDIYFRKIHVFLNIIENIMLLGHENLAKNIISLIKCFTLRYSPCFIKYTLELITYLISNDDKQ
jgi:hypothetical protein